MLKNAIFQLKQQVINKKTLIRIEYYDDVSKSPCSCQSQQKIITINVDPIDKVELNYNKEDDEAFGEREILKKLPLTTCKSLKFKKQKIPKCFIDDDDNNTINYKSIDDLLPSKKNESNTTTSTLSSINIKILILECSLCKPGLGYEGYYPYFSVVVVDNIKLWRFAIYVGEKTDEEPLMDLHDYFSLKLVIEEPKSFQYRPNIFLGIESNISEAINNSGISSRGWMWDFETNLFYSPDVTNRRKTAFEKYFITSSQCNIIIQYNYKKNFVAVSGN